MSSRTVPFTTATTRAFQGRDWQLGERVVGDFCATRTVTVDGRLLGAVLDTLAPGKNRWRAIDNDGQVRGYGLTDTDVAAVLIRNA